MIQEQVRRKGSRSHQQPPSIKIFPLLIAAADLFNFGADADLFV
jgi:hypothetical protein